jgi:heme/copper-type cytochrome/quinol oxidase subunit 4
MDIYFYRRLRHGVFAMTNPLTLRITGFFSSLILSLVSFSIIIDPHAFNLEINAAVIAIFILALGQSLVQLYFFIDVWEEEDGTQWNLGVFASTVSIIFIIIFFSMWIINHLNYNMR